MKLSDLIAKTKSVSLNYGGESLTLQVRTEIITPKLVADLASLDDASVSAAARLQSAAELLVKLVASWDLYDADGVTMFPLDVARLESEVPLALQQQCLLSAVQSLQPGEAPAPAA